MVLLARSLLSVRSPGMPLKITGRLTVKVCSSSSVYSVLAPLEIPVAIIQSVSENSHDIQLKLSNPIVQLFRAAINKSSTFRGFRNSVVLGSTVFRMILAHKCLANFTLAVDIDEWIIANRVQHLKQPSGNQHKVLLPDIQH